MLDVRWALGKSDGYQQYVKEHLPGAVYVDLERELAAQGCPEAGRHPLPPPEEFERAAQRWGINHGDTVVAYDDAGTVSAARVWWLLRDAGHKRVQLLDGGLTAWRSAGYPLDAGDVAAERGDVRLTAGHMPQISMDEAARFPQIGALLDARASERYRGEIEPVDPRAGHIPGARNMPTTDTLSAEGTFHSAEDLRRRFAAVGAEGNVPVAVYCGSGVAAAHEIAAAEIAGVSAALYPGSWSQWSNHVQLPVSTGSE